MSDLVQKNHRGEHVTFWLEAYLDNEVSAGLRDQIENHLAGCPTCQDELAELENLSAMLQSVPGPKFYSSDSAFARQVLERLSQPDTPLWKQFFQMTWRYAPLMIFTVWAFVQSVGIISGAAGFFLFIFPGAGAVWRSLMPLNEGARASLLGDFLRMNLNRTSIGQAMQQAAWLEPTAFTILVNVIIPVVLTALFLGWLASWWAYSTRQKKKAEAARSSLQSITGSEK